MAKELTHEEFNAGKLPKLWDFLVELHKTSPEAFQSDGQYLRAIVAQRWKLLDQKSICPNCSASMAQYKVSVNYKHATLLRAMAYEVDSKRRKGLEFTDANKTHVQSQLDVDYATKSCTSMCRQLGLIAKVMKDGVHDQEAGWAITRRGWAFLQNQPVPKSVIVFRNEIIDRTEETTTIQEVLAEKGDDYNRDFFVQVAGYEESTL